MKNKRILTQSYVIAVMLYIASIINYLDRAAIAISMVYISQDISISAVDKGLVFSAFSIGYLPFNFLGGYLSDKMPPTKLFGICILLWSILSGLTGTVASLWQLLIVRLLFGMSEGPLSSNINKIINDVFPKDTSVTWISIVDSATPIGTAVAGLLIPFFAIRYSWRMSFIIIMIVGITWSTVWCLLSKKLIKTNKPRQVSKMQIAGNKRTINTRKTFLFLNITIYYFLYNLFLYFLISWLPVYLMKIKTINSNEKVIINSLPWLLGSGSMLLGGIFSRYLGKKKDFLQGYNYIKIIRFCLACSSFSIILLGNIKEHIVVLLLILTFCVVALYFTGGLYWGVINEIYPAQKVGTMGGIMHGCANLATVLGPIFVGIIVQFFNNYAVAFGLIGFIGIILLVISNILLAKIKE